MNTVLFTKEFKRNLKKFLLWMAFIIGFNIFTIMFYPSLASNQEILEKFMEVYPKEIAGIFNFSVETWSTPLGFQTTYFAFYVLMLGGIYTALLGGSILAKEEGGKTADFLMTRPMTRTEFIITKMAVFLVYVIMMNLVVYLTTVIMYAVATDGINVARLTVLSLYGLMYTLMFGFLGMFVSVLVKRGRSVTGAMAGAVIGCYFLEAISRISEKSKNIGYISPNRFVDMNVAGSTYGLSPGDTAYFLVLAAVFAVAAFIIYRKKDIYV